MCNPSGWLPNPLGPNAQFQQQQPFQSPNTHNAKPMKETQKRAETFNRGNLFTKGKGETQSRIKQTFKEMQSMYKQKALKQFLLTDRPTDRHTHRYPEGRGPVHLVWFGRADSNQAPARGEQNPDTSEPRSASRAPLSARPANQTSPLYPELSRRQEVSLFVRSRRGSCRGRISLRPIEPRFS